MQMKVTRSLRLMGLSSTSRTRGPSFVGRVCPWLLIGVMLRLGGDLFTSWAEICCSLFNSGCLDTE